jgi:hypothetical protein
VPEDPAAIQRLASALEQLAAVDDFFAARIRVLWPQVQLELAACDGGIVNISSGRVEGHLIQARDLHVEGSLQLGDVARRPHP